MHIHCDFVTPAEKEKLLQVPAYLLIKTVWFEDKKKRKARGKRMKRISNKIGN